MVTRRIRFSGRVQGVGFRRRTQELAEATEVVGFVRNLIDGSVEVVAQGEADVVTTFVGRIRARMHREIAEVQESEVEPQDFQGFRIDR